MTDEAAQQAQDSAAMALNLQKSKRIQLDNFVLDLHLQMEGERMQEKIKVILSKHHEKIEDV